MGMVDEQQPSQFLRRHDPRRGSRREGIRKFPAEQYLDYVAEHVEPWSYVKFCYLKPLGWQGFAEGPESSIYAWRRWRA